MSAPEFSRPEFSRPEFSRPEFSRMVDRRSITAAPVQLTATPQECAALARRFGLIAVQRLEAVVDLAVDGEVVAATGRIAADIVQPCAVSGEELPVVIAERLDLRFVPEAPSRHSDAEIELAEAELDEIPYAGTSFDLGEALAQTLALAIDPYLTGPQAEAARVAAGITPEDAPRGALAEALAGLRKGS